VEIGLGAKKFLNKYAINRDTTVTVNGGQITTDNTSLQIVSKVFRARLYVSRVDGAKTASVNILMFSLVGKSLE